MSERDKFINLLNVIIDRATFTGGYSEWAGYKEAIRDAYAEQEQAEKSLIQIYDDLVTERDRLRRAQLPHRVNKVRSV